MFLFTSFNSSRFWFVCIFHLYTRFSGYLWTHFDQMAYPHIQIHEWEGKKIRSQFQLPWAVLFLCLVRSIRLGMLLSNNYEYTLLLRSVPFCPGLQRVQNVWAPKRREWRASIQKSTCICCKFCTRAPIAKDLWDSTGCDSSKMHWKFTNVKRY